VPRRADGNRLEIWLEAKPEAVASVRGTLERAPLPEDLLEDAKLLATELVTNCIRHARFAPEELIEVQLEWSSSTVRVIVRGGTAPAGFPPVAGSIRPDPGAQSGWGLYLVDQIASRWGTNLDGRPGYWFELEPSAVPEP
jgi:serine/threonine-protein kinase RsbW